MEFQLQPLEEPFCLWWEVDHLDARGDGATPGIKLRPNPNSPPMQDFLVEELVVVLDHTPAPSSQVSGGDGTTNTGGGGGGASRFQPGGPAIGVNWNWFRYMVVQV